MKHVILITGALGAIGLGVLDELLAHGAYVIANDIVSEQEARTAASEHHWASDRHSYMRADITNAEISARPSSRVPVRANTV